MIYTVLTYHEDSLQTSAHHVEAKDGQDALYKVAKEHGGELIVAVAGECHEAFAEEEETKIGTMTYPGDGLVESQSYIEIIDEDRKSSESERLEYAEKTMATLAKALQDIAAITTCEGTEAEAMAAKIQGICRIALEDGN